MDKKITIEHIANKLNMSKTTVSKAINNCPGVNSETKKIVMEAANDYGYVSSRPPQKTAVILPAVPNYFWGDMRKKIAAYGKTAEIEYKFYVYPNLHDKNDALRCVEQAVGEGTSVLIVAVPDTDGIRALLEGVASRVLVILIEEFLDIKNTFYIGANSFEQGYQISKRYIENYPNASHFAVLRSTDFHTEKMRVGGFLRALEEHGGELVLSVRSEFGSKIQSANIARALSHAKEIPDCIFCPSGNLVMAALAVKKLKSDKSIHCIGFDINTESGTDGYKNILTNILIQDTDTQAKTAVECATEFLRHGCFPKRKIMYVDGIYKNYI